jgi:hypothetical protein
MSKGIDITRAHYKEMGDRAVQTLISLGCMKCSKCQRWMDKEFISVNGSCNECDPHEPVVPFQEV